MLRRRKEELMAKRLGRQAAEMKSKVRIIG